MPHFVKVNEDGSIKEFWDCLPPVPVGTDGWRNATLSIPNIDHQKQEYGDFLYDITQDPVVVSREVKNFSVEQRKDILVSKNQNEMFKIIEIAKSAPSYFSEQEIQSFKSKASNNKIAIQNCSTHSDLDNLILDSIDFI